MSHSRRAGKFPLGYVFLPEQQQRRREAMGDLNQLAQGVMKRAAGLTLYARQWVDDPASAEDVVQEALASLLAQHPPPSDPIAWMFRAVRNAAIDQARSSSSRRRREQAVAQSRREWFQPRADALIDAETAKAALANLPPTSREIVVLRIWSDLGFAQIADVMQTSLSTVHDRYVGALQQMRAALEKQPCSPRRTT
jgi:RNA polymerase sigma-70 factor (ECF subfamily)